MVSVAVRFYFPDSILLLLPGQAPEKVVVVVPPEPENVEIVDKDAGVARLHDVVAGHEFDAGVARERVFGVRDDDELLPGILPHALRQLFVRGIEMIQNEFFRSRTVEELPAALDRYLVSSLASFVPSAAA